MYANQSNPDTDPIMKPACFAKSVCRLPDSDAQKIYLAENSILLVADYLRINGSKTPFFVCGKTAKALAGWGVLCREFPNAEIFSEYSANPDYECALAGAKRFISCGCDAIVAIGGGSAIDVAKAVKLFSAMNTEKNCLCQTSMPLDVPFLAVPTTAGTGSESTHFAVLYVRKKKQSLAHPDLLPDTVFLDSSLLCGLPYYQKCCTVMDALAQCIESVWAREAGPQSQDYACKGIRLLKSNLEEYLKGEPRAAQQVLLGANYSGRAINLSKTTAAHAMSYGLTTCLHIPHGHAVALALPPVWQRLLEWQRQNCDVQLEKALSLIDKAFSFLEHTSSLAYYCSLCAQMQLGPPNASQKLLHELIGFVNVQRMENFPFRLPEEDIKDLYREMLF